MKKTTILFLCMTLSVLGRGGVSKLIEKTIPESVPEGWEVYECKLRGYYDGDSFSAVSSDGQRFVWRLYRCDAPETSNDVPDRLRKQAAFFKIPERKVVKWGKKAKRRAGELLRRGFTVYTKKEDAKGKNKRFFAVIYVDGKDLAQILCLEGLADSFGKPPPHFPGGSKKSELAYSAKMKELKAIAKEGKIGIWSERK